MCRRTVESNVNLQVFPEWLTLRNFPQSRRTVESNINLQVFPVSKKNTKMNMIIDNYLLALK